MGRHCGIHGRMHFVRASLIKRSGKVRPGYGEIDARVNAILSATRFFHLPVIYSGAFHLNVSRYVTYANFVQLTTPISP